MLYKLYASKDLSKPLELSLYFYIGFENGLLRSFSFYGDLFLKCFLENH